MANDIAGLVQSLLSASEKGDYGSFFNQVSAFQPTGMKPLNLPRLGRSSLGRGKGPRATPKQVSQIVGHLNPKSPAGVIQANAKRFGLDPAAVLAYSLEEAGGKWGPVGDKGTSFGPFQAHIGGAAGNRTVEQARAWANSPAGLIQMMGMMSRAGARGLTGEEAVRAIYKGFGKGTPTAVPKGIAMYGEARRMLSAKSKQAVTPQVKGGWQKYVTFAGGADRSGVHTNPMVPTFVAKIASIYGSRLTIGTGTNHNQYVAGTNRQSDHWTGDAADIPMVGNALTRLGRDALIAAGADPVWARQQTGGAFNINGYNILFNTTIGGNHWNHLHVGLGRRPGSNRSRGY